MGTFPFRLSLSLFGVAVVGWGVVGAFLLPWGGVCALFLVMVRDGPGRERGAGGPAAGGEEEGPVVAELDPPRHGGARDDAGRRQVRDHAPRADPRAGPAHPGPALVLPLHHPWP